NNTIVSAVTGSLAALRIKDGGAGCTVQNNILLGGDGNCYRISNDSLPGLVSDYNIVTNSFQSEDSGSTETLAQWRAQTGQDLHSSIYSSYQLFANPGGNDYHLAEA